MLNIKIINENQRKLLERRELDIEAIFDGPTPKKQDLLKEIASLTKTKENLIVLRRVNQVYGTSKAKVLVYVYSSEEALKKTEPKEKKSKEKKEQPKEEAK